MKIKKLILLLLPVLLALSSTSLYAQYATVHVSTSEACNVRIRDASGKYFRPETASSWKMNGTEFPGFASDGTFDLQLPPGNYTFELDRGPEYYLHAGSFTMADKDLTLDKKLKRIVDLKDLHWWSGEFHVHRKVEDMELLMEASDIHIAPVITSWNENFPFARTDTTYNFSIRKFDDSRFYSVTGSEDERSGGAILVLNTARPVDFSRAESGEYPPLAASVHQVRAAYKDDAWIDIEKPFWMDVPILLATGEINSIGIAHNHMNQDSVFDNEAWGKARDRNNYPSPMGNGLWTQDIYYHILNAGLRIPPSAGSASGVLLNPVGYNRIYAYVEQKLRYANWFQAVKEGKTFVTNGPLLICKANGQWPGEVFSSDEKLSIRINATVYSRDPIEAIDIIKDGTIVKSLTAEEVKDHAFSSEVLFDRSGWFLARVICSTPNNFRFASTAPFYVEVGSSKRRISKTSARFFLDWVNERAATITIKNTQQKSQLMDYVTAARRYWEHVLNKATDP